MAAEADPVRPKPCKVWNVDRTLRKSVVASSFVELTEKGRAKLGLEEPVTVVLEEDGTEVDDDDYFQCLEPNTTFILLCNQEKWRPERGNLNAVDEPDFQGQIVSDGPSCEDPRSQLFDIVKTIREDQTRIITLSNSEMEVLVNADQKEFASLMGIDVREAGRIQLSCHRYLDDRTEALDAIALLKTCDKANKRQRTH